MVDDHVRDTSRRLGAFRVKGFRSTNPWTRSTLPTAAVAVVALFAPAGDVTQQHPVTRSAKPESSCTAPLPNGRTSPAPAPRGASRPVKGGIDRGGDFNGDGRRDIAVSVPFRMTDMPDSALSGKWSGAYVAVIPSGPHGPDPARRQIITHDCLDVPTRGKPNHTFGTALDSADFDRDGYDDLVVVGQNGGYNGLGDATVTIVYGSANGLTSRAVELISSGTGSFFDKVAIGDFGGNGELDIVAAPGAFGDLHLFRNVVDRPVAVERSRLIRKPPHGRGAEDSFESLQVADFNADGRSDLAVMVEWSAMGERSYDWGELRLGGPRGLSGRATVFGRGRVGLESMAGDVTGDGRPDLVMRDTGRTMSVAPGTSTGLGAPQRFTLPPAPEPLNPGLGEPPPNSGTAPGFTVGDVTGDGTADVTVTENGKVAVLPGGPGGVRAAQAEILDKEGLPQPAGSDLRQIGGLSVGDVTGDGAPDLVIGAPEWSTRAGGRLYILPGGQARGATTISGTQLGLVQRPNGGFGQVLLP
ncbi:FG-GAP and VCBS repeat-containing protein [Spirillospora sp. NPDC050679]